MEGLHLEVQEETVREENGYLHGFAGEWNGNPVPFFCDPERMDILIPESLEPVYPELKAAILRYLKKTGRIK